MTDVLEGQERIDGTDVDEVAEGEVISAQEAARLKRLNEIAIEIDGLVGRGRQSIWDAVEIYFAIGRRLSEARGLLHSDREFGGWCKDQGFTWSRQWLLVLRKGAEHEDAVRGVLTSWVDAAQREGLPLSALNFKKAVSTIEKPRQQELPEEAKAEVSSENAGERVEVSMTLWQAPWTLNAERGQVTFAHRRRTKEWRKAWRDLALAEEVQRLATAQITVQPIQRNRASLADTGACYPAVKAAIDGLVDADVLPEDGPSIVTSICFYAPLVDEGAAGAKGLRLTIEGVAR